MEAHLVHFNSKYGGIQEAAGHLDGLSIISLLFTVKKTKPVLLTVQYLIRF